MNTQAALLCPRCRIDLHVGQAAGAVLHGCGACGGIWADMQTSHRLCEALDGDTRALVDSAERHAAHVPDTAQAIACPVCAQALARTRIQNAGVDLDYCAAHGTWFDRGELGKIAQATAIQRAYGRGAPAALAGPAAGTAAGAVSASAGAAAAPASGSDDDTANEVADVAVDVGIGIIGALLESMFD